MNCMLFKKAVPPCPSDVPAPLLGSIGAEKVAKVNFRWSGNKTVDSDSIHSEVKLKSLKLVFTSSISDANH